MRATIDELAHERARELVALAVEEERQRWTSLLEGQTATEAVLIALRAIERAAAKSRGTYVGAHQIALRALRAAGVPGLEQHPTLRRTRAQIEADRDREFMEGPPTRQ